MHFQLVGAGVGTADYNTDFSFFFHDQRADNIYKLYKMLPTNFLPITNQLRGDPAVTGLTPCFSQKLVRKFEKSDETKESRPVDLLGFV